MKAWMNCVVVLVAALGMGIEMAAAGEGQANGTSNAKRGAEALITPEIVRKISTSLTDTCTASENPTYAKNAALGGLSPGFSIVNALNIKYGIRVAGEVKAVITQQPRHGKIAMIGLDDQTFPASPTEVFEYTPDKDFLGDDKAAFEVTVNDQKFRISYVIKVVQGGFNDTCVQPTNR